MWYPLDPYAIPSKEEIQSMRSIIDDLEARLHAATIADPRSVPSMVDDLEKEIAQRKAWIAPIRRVPYDILSIVFLQTCQVDMKAPFTLGAVCASWRRSLLDTPRAWAFIQLHRLDNFDAIRTVLDRSAPHTLYVDMPSKCSDHLSHALVGYTERVGCSRMNGLFFRTLQNPFPNLTKLAVFTDTVEAASWDPWDLLDGTKFPCLRCLFSDSHLDWAMGTLPPHTLLPPITEMSLSTRHPRFVAGVIRLLADKLTLLLVAFFQPDYNTDDDRPMEIVFPRLLDLTIIYSLDSHVARIWPFNARTPVLASYRQDPHSPGCAIHRDTQTVTHLECRVGMTFKLFPQIHEVASDYHGTHDLMGHLEKDPQGWPHIEIIRCEYHEEIAERVDAFNVKHNRNIRYIPTDPAWAATLYRWIEFPVKYKF